MDTNVNYTMVGAFVILLITFIIFGIIWLSSGFAVESYKTYMVHMAEAVTGLNVDAPVEYNGVNVGIVNKIALNKNNPHLVDLTLSIKSDTPITQGTVAMLDSKGITGISYLALKDDGTDLRPLRAIGKESYPTIKTAPSLLLRLDTALKKLNSSLSTVSTSIQAVLDPENLRSIKQTLKNLDHLTYSLASNGEKLTAIMNNTAKASQSFVPTMQILNTQTLPEVNRVISNFAVISSDIKQNPAILIRGAAPQPLGPGEK